MNYLLILSQPVVLVFEGLLVLGVYYYLQLSRKSYLVRWIARSIFRNHHMLPSAQSLFNVMASFLFVLGGIWIIMAIYYLSNG
jgi:hypothetical protein